MSINYDESAYYPDEYDYDGPVKPWKGHSKRALWESAEEQKAQMGTLKFQIKELQREIETMRKHWAPIPIKHQYTPKAPQCMYCDAGQDDARHQP